MKKLSMIACGLLISSSALFAESAVQKAFKDGKVSGDISVFSKTKSTDGAATDEGFTAGSIGLNYETAEVSGFKANFGFRANHEFAEEEDGQYDGDFQNNAIMNVASITYKNDLVALTVGRQEIDLEWLGDYNEAVVAAITAIPNTTIVAGYTTRQASVGNDESGKFADVTKDGAYVVDAKYKGIENLVINPYFYSAVDVADFYGLKVEFDNDTFGATAQYAASSEDTQKDGDIANVEIKAKFSPVSIAAGYITTNKDVGAGSISAYGDNVNPFEDGNNVYSADAQTMYASASVEVASLEISALYGITEYGANDAEDKELNVGAKYKFNDELEAEVLYVNGDVEGTSDYNTVQGAITYSF
jgi:hypothetical protein